MLAAILVPGIASAQSSPELETGRRLVAQLTINQAADSKLFDAIGYDRALPLLTAVMNQDQRKGATAEEWKELHAAAAGLVELFVYHKELYKASIFAEFQDTFYRNLEEDYESALKAARMALDLQERSGERGTLSIVHFNIGKDLLSLGDTGEALAEFRRTHELENDPLATPAADHWRQMILAEIAENDLVSAREELSRLMAASAAAPPVFRARALMAQSDLRIAEGKYTEALQIVQQARALDLAKDDRSNFEVEVSYQLLTCVLASIRALPYDEALALAGKVEHDFANLEIPVTPFARQVITVRRRLSGDLEGILKEDYSRLEQARVSKSLHGQIEALGSIAVTYSAMHARAQQIAALQQALDLEESMLPETKIPKDYASADSYFQLLNELGTAYANGSEISKARSAFDRVVRGIDAISDATLRRQLAQQYSDARLGKARVAELDDDPDEARDLLNAELRARPGSAWTLLQFARMERDLNEKPARASELYTQAIQAFEKDHNRSNALVARLEYTRYLATSARATLPGALENARQQIADAEFEAAALKSADAQWLVQFDKGLIHESENKPEAAITNYRAAIALIEGLRSGLTQEEQRQSLTDTPLIQDVYARLVGLLAAQHSDADAWQYIEQRKARAFLEMLGGRRFQALPSEEQKIAPVRDLEAKIASLRAELTPMNASVLRGAGRDPAQTRSELQTLEAKFTAARQEDALLSSRAGQPLALKPIALAKVASLLPEHTALIEYSILNDSIGAFVITGGGTTQKTWPAKTEVVGHRVFGLRSYLINPDSGPDIDAAIAEMSKLVIEPIAASIPADVDHLLIVPSGQLSYLPFQVLQLPDGKPMIERFSIGYLPSASTLEFLKPETAAGGSLFLGALGDVSVEGMPPLPGTLRETDGIAKVYTKTKPARVTGNAFTHDQAREALLHYDVVHLATHGVVDQDAPLFSAVLTAGSESRLSLYEITNLNLKARLVILSACETGLGKMLGGDEIAGLTRTFLTAGASTVVSSLWKVSDDSTALLMQKFHEQLRDGVTPAPAMRAAALEVRKRYPHPFYWAPFIVTGPR